MPGTTTAAGGSFGTGGGSIITQPAGGIGKPTIDQRELETFQQVFFSVKDLQDPERLYQVVYFLMKNTKRIFRILGQSPIGGGNLLINNAFNTGQTRYLQHGLGHAYRGYFCTRQQGLAGSFVEAAFPAAVTAASVLPITSANAGTYDFYVF